MHDFLDALAIAARENLENEYYRSNIKMQREKTLSLKEAILRCKRAAVISEIKFSSPSSSFLRNKGDAGFISKEMADAGAVGISVLTEPKHFSGSLEALMEARKSVDTPILMKDIILSRCQIDIAHNLGADAVLLIEGLFERGYCEADLYDMIRYSHKNGLEVLLETHDIEEFRAALSTDADLIGINNRDLKTFKVDINVTKNVLEKFTRADIEGKIIVSESGIKTPHDIRFLRERGADAFLVGSAIMAASSIKEAVAWLVSAYEES